MTPIAKKIKALANSKYYTTKTEYSTTASKYLCLAAKDAGELDVLAEVRAYMDQLGLDPYTALMRSLIKDFTLEAMEEALSFIKTNIYDDWDNRPATLEELQQRYIESYSSD